MHLKRVLIMFGQYKKLVTGLERCLSKQEYTLLFQRTLVQFQVPTRSKGSDAFSSPIGHCVYGKQTFMKAKTLILITIFLIKNKFMKMLLHWNMLFEVPQIFTLGPWSHVFGSRINRIFYSLEVRAVSFMDNLFASLII